MNPRIILILGILGLTAFAQAQNDISYTQWQDPTGMFSLEVPDGWSTSGGTYHDALGTLCYYVITESPDQSIIVDLGDPRQPGTHSNTFMSGASSFSGIGTTIFPRVIPMGTCLASRIWEIMPVL